MSKKEVISDPRYTRERINFFVGRLFLGLGSLLLALRIGFAFRGYSVFLEGITNVGLAWLAVEEYLIRKTVNSRLRVPIFALLTGGFFWLQKPAYAVLPWVVCVVYVLAVSLFREVESVDR